MDILHAYQKVANEPADLPTMQRGSFDANTSRYNDPTTLWDALQALAPQQGWIQFQSHQCAFQNSLPEPEEHWGQLLAAEACDANGNSIHLSQNNQGGWLISHYQHQTSGEMLCDETTQLAYDLKLSQLRYRRYWRHEPGQGYVQTLACFIGFEGGERP